MFRLADTLAGTQAIFILFFDLAENKKIAVKNYDNEHLHLTIDIFMQRQLI